MRSALYLFILFSVSISSCYAGVMVYGTRFYLYEGDDTRVRVKNSGEGDFLIKTSVKATSQGGRVSTPRSYTISALPPLFKLKGNSENDILLKCLDCRGLPHDTETLFTLTVSVIPSASNSDSSVQVGFRYHFRLIYRPKSVKFPVSKSRNNVLFLQGPAKSGYFLNNTPLFLTLVNPSTQTRLNVSPLSRTESFTCERMEICKSEWYVINESGSLTKLY